MSRLAGASPPTANLRGLDADKWQRGHVGPPVAVAWWQPDIATYSLPAGWRRSVRTARLRYAQRLGGTSPVLRKCNFVRCGADMASARWRIVLDQPSPAARPGTRYAWQLWHTPATAKLHNAALLSVSASQSQAPFVAATASRPLGEGNGRYAKLPTLERSHSRRRFPVSSCPTRRRLRALLVGVAPWHQSGAARIVLVSGLRPVMLCVPPPTLGGLPLRGFGPARHCPSAPQGGSLSPRGRPALPYF